MTVLKLGARRSGCSRCVGEQRGRLSRKCSGRRADQRGVTLLGLLIWAIVIGFAALLGMRVFPTVNEYYTIQHAVEKIAGQGLTTVPEIRSAFDKTMQIEYSISSIGSKDLDITKENDKIVISFAYDKEVEVMSPVFLLIKYKGGSKSK